MKTNKLHQLQVLRFFAALMVAVSHALPTIAIHTHSTVLAYPELIGRAGVSIFFIISGFIMIYTCHDDFGRPSASLSFLKKRAIRIIPIYWIMSTVAYIIATFGSGGNIGCRPNAIPYFIASLLFIPVARCDGAMLPSLAQGWTLNYEVLFYILFAIAQMFSRMIGSAVVIVTLIALTVTGIVMTGGEADPSMTFYYTNYLMILFAVGMLAGLIYVRYGHLIALKHSFLFVSGVLGAVVFAQQLVVSDANPFNEQIPLLAAAIIVLSALFLTSGEEASGRFGRLVEYLGDASYSIYLIHIFALTAFVKLLGLLNLWSYSTPGWIAVYVFFYSIFCSCFGMVVYTLVERPMNIRLRRVMAVRAVPVAFASTPTQPAAH